jgi:hypothetical protein
LLTEVLERLGLSVPETDAGLVAALLWERCRNRMLDSWLKNSADRTAPADLLQRIDLLDAVRGELWGFNPVKAAWLQARVLRWALEAGEPERLVGALSLEACVIATDGSERAARRADQLFERAAFLARRVSTPDAHGVLSANRAVVAWMLGQSVQSIEWAQEVEKVYRERPHNERAYFLRFTATAVRAGALHDLGQYAKFVEEVDGAAKHARATENQMALLQFAFNEAVADAVRGTPEAAIARLEAQRRLLPRQFGILRVLHMLAVVYAACSTGRFEWGVELFNQDWPLYLESPIGRTAYLALLARSARVRLLINAAVAAGWTVDAAKLVKSDLEEIRKHPSPIRQPIHRAYMARIAALTGNRTAATEHMLEAVREFEKLGRLGEAACARYAYGRWLSGEAGDRHCEASHAILEQQGVKVPRAFVKTYYPEVFRSD